MSVQVYNNKKNYELNKQRFQADVQQALDLAMEGYYANRAKKRTGIFAKDLSFFSFDTVRIKSNAKDSIFINLSQKKASDSSKFSFKIGSDNEFVQEESFMKSGGDSLFSTARFSDDMKPSPFDFDLMKKLEQIASKSKAKSIEIGVQRTAKADSLKEMGQFVSKLVFSLTQEPFDLQELDSLVAQELERKSINLDYVLKHQMQDTALYSKEIGNNYPLSSFSSTTFLPKEEQVAIQYQNATFSILKRGMTEVVISLAVTLAVIGALVYLYGIIKQQKELAAIKNDLISNITHEFKTPIATISTAIEGISVFNKANDPEKTEKYLKISGQQLGKLNHMVEKLLETASLDRGTLEIHPEPIEIVAFTKQLIERYRLLADGQTITFHCDFEAREEKLDAFHWENALGNLLDNALKYGGDRIEVSLNEAEKGIRWTITDNGKGIDPAHRPYLFEKFYRVPTGNVHNVKGFGIGLYYTKTIVERHGGRVFLKEGQKKTQFVIEL